jgi:hypothetical protein
MPCSEDEIVCEGNTAKVCDGMGGFKSEEACPSVCAEGLGARVRRVRAELESV